MNIKKEIIERNNKTYQVSIFYDKGGLSYFGGSSGSSGSSSKRGYYLSVVPCRVENGMVSITLFSGFKKLLVEVERQSKRKKEEALKAAVDFVDPLINQLP